MTAYFVPDAKVHLSSPQLYFKEVNGGISAHHQNGVAEGAIGTITKMARAM
jgi:hypothetical protein